METYNDYLDLACKQLEISLIRKKKLKRNIAKYTSYEPSQIVERLNISNKILRCIELHIDESQDKIKNLIYLVCENLPKDIFKKGVSKEYIKDAIVHELIMRVLLLSRKNK